MARAIVSPKAAPERPADPFQEMPTAQARNSGRATPSRRSVLVPLTGRLLRRRVAGFYSAVDSQDLARRRGLGHEGNGTHREPLAPLACRPEIDMDEPRSRVEAEAEESDLAGRGLESHRVVVRHGDIEGGAVEVLRSGRAAHGAVVLGAAIGGTHDQRLAEPVAQRLQLVERRFVDEQLASAPA